MSDFAASIDAVMGDISMMAAATIGYIGMAIMCYGAFKALVHFIVSNKRDEDDMTEIRVDLAKHLSLGLEFLIGKDIIETLIQPSFEQLALLAGLVAIRTAISYLLARELKEAIEEITDENTFEKAVQEYEKTRSMHRNGHRKK